MKTAHSVQWYSLALLLFSTLAAAWPWPSWLPEMGTALVARQDKTSSSSSSSGDSSPDPTATSSPDDKKQDNDNDNDSDGSSSSNSTSPSKSTSFDPRLPAGGISMQTPALLAGPQYYKIGFDPITFGWNYTSLLAEPTAIDVLATCTENKQLYTIAANQSFSKESGSAVWDTREYQDNNRGDPLINDMYTLIIKDSDVELTATAQAGYLGTYQQYAFGMYIPKAPTPLSEFQCATCNGALGKLEMQALKTALGVCVVTVASFTWFVGGTGVIW